MVCIVLYLRWSRGAFFVTRAVTAVAPMAEEEVLMAALVVTQVLAQVTVVALLVM